MYSARVAAFVLESSPPMITIAVRPFFLAFSATILNCSCVSSLVRPDPMISKPPVFLYSSMNLSSNSTKSFLRSPSGPPLNPRRTLPESVALSASYRPQTTLCPPGACPPERITPTTCFLAADVLVPFSNVISFLP